MKKFFYLYLVCVSALSVFAYFFMPWALVLLVVLLPLAIVGLRDLWQNSHAIKKNYPIVGNLRYLLEEIRPEINQYFIESNTEGRPFSREARSIVYQRAKKQVDTIAFGTQQNFYEEGYEFLTHSLYPTHIDPKTLRVQIGSKLCMQPYSASLLNISAMSYGSLSKNAILSLNGGARDGEFAHNSGEGGLSPHHLKNGGDIIWQIGTGYFGCRDEEGKFDPDYFKLNALRPEVKMIEIKLSQGAKPGHGGILPARKVTEEISKIRNVPMSKDVISPPGHSAFHDPESMIRFIQRLRGLSGGKPIGIKMCLGHAHEFDGLIDSMKKLELYPDFIVVDCAEGGTGAAPLEFSNHIGTPGKDALIYVADKLQEAGLRDEIKIIATGKVATAFDLVRLLCLGADAVYSARSMLLALGCIQALKCNTNNCPTGIATQNPDLAQGLHVPTKRLRVKNYHQETLKIVAEMLGAMGLKSHTDLNRSHLYRRLHNSEIRSYAD
ncbi:FMN-binding glutamate synthase family protein [Bacteriovorax stolpii]|uniref:FMN-binding glutamate synthase family protein n=1 Tax=Bacteriovorax stolpii TaxID=960 RepID=A0A2K9NTU5_BACTC|nr:FMN-binding glutamate synthase family protein [Bacteriovorax stolpii]AUN98918.1 FMN-binding glutamate synthase family protein [Bacteriovorax stolpii]QDK41086.1 FMN-binding glutamate synthase family protein [Bacteriovorax stolpii]TDP55556.1 glutamate synthase domain-containing protein 2 [Bacteriovorax stolpii]